jgi:hypothetical protein
MPSRNVHSEGVQVVAVGSFNPTEFSPGWFKDSGVVGESELLNLNAQFISPQGSMFELAWLRIEVMPNRLAFTTLDAQEFLRLRDAALSVFRLKDETALTNLAINRFIHINMSGIEDFWHQIGDNLVAKEYWDDILRFPGTGTVQVTGLRKDGFRGQESVIVQPSNLTKPGLFIELNDHRVLERDNVEISSRNDPRYLTMMDPPADLPIADRIDFAVEVLTAGWESTEKTYTDVVNRIWSLGEAR